MLRITFHIFEKDFEQTISQAETQELRIIRMIGEFYASSYGTASVLLT